jgi:beta-lactamase superfamily II metal-dependent hydrolase
VFGRGFGEAICVHVGGKWTLVDSCINPETGAAAAATYLEALGVGRSAVCLVLITHWDDDHIAGVQELVERFSDATVACSLALNRQDIQQFVIEQGQVSGGVGSGLDELRAVLMKCRSNGRLLWAKATLPLHPREAGGSPMVTALSPSDDAVMRSIESLIGEATGEQIAFRRRYRAAEGPNGASVAATVAAGETSILLGADLEDSNNPLSGWAAVLAQAKPTHLASIVKVPHHGSEGAHKDEMWEEIVNAKPLAIVTPWVRGAGHLPTAADLARLRNVADRVYLTAMPTLRRARKDPAVDKIIAKVAGVRIDELRGWGHVRARRKLGEDSWTVALDGDARLVDEDP